MSDSPLSLQVLPGDDVRQIMWRYQDRYDLQMLVQSSRQVARGPVAHAVANGERNSHDWTPGKHELLSAYDQAGITAAFMEPEYNGYIEGPKNMALGLIAFEMAWVDAGAATCSLANNLGLAPIHEKGTAEQKKEYLTRCVPGATDKLGRAAFCLTEPLPFVGVDTGMLSGRVRVSEWKEGEEPVLHVEKRGRFITNMGFANIVTAAVQSDDDRLKGSCMVILEEGDEGTFDRGTPTKKMVHQLSSTSDPAFDLKIPASRIVGGYTIKDGCIHPNCNLVEMLGAVFRHTRVTVGLMTSAKLLSSIEPVIRYQRNRFRGGNLVDEESPRYQLGLQQQEDALYRLGSIWAMGEASASLGFAAARLFDELDPMQAEMDKMMEAEGIVGARAQLRYFRKLEKDAKLYLTLSSQSELSPTEEMDLENLKNNFAIQYLIKSKLGDILCPACKLWNTGNGANAMREAVSLMGGYGITEDCPGFLGQKWMDSQLEATYEGPEAVQRRQLSVTMTSEIFLEQFSGWIKELRQVASDHPAIGACNLASAMELWMWTLDYLQNTTDNNGKPLYHSNRQGVSFPMADALSWMVASYYQIKDILELKEKGKDHPALSDGAEGMVNFFADLSYVQTARAAGEVGRICSDLVSGYNTHKTWENVDSQDGSFYNEQELDEMEGCAPGISCCASAYSDVFTAEGEHPTKVGPCARWKGMDSFNQLKTRLDGCRTGSRLAQDRVARALTEVMIPEALDYPL